MAVSNSTMLDDKKGLSDEGRSGGETSSSAPPPSYSRDASKPPPDYPDPGLVDPKTQLPKTFRVGSHDVPPCEFGTKHEAEKNEGRKNVELTTSRSPSFPLWLVLQWSLSRTSRLISYSLVYLAPALLSPRTLDLSFGFSVRLTFFGSFDSPSARSLREAQAAHPLPPLRPRSSQDRSTSRQRGQVGSLRQASCLEVRKVVSWSRASEEWRGSERRVQGRGDASSRLVSIYSLSLSIEKLLFKAHLTLSLRSADVLMVWHSYTLNPRVYHSDLLLRPSLSSLASSFPLLLVTSQIDSSTLLFTHSSIQQSTFTRLTHGFSSSLPHTTSFSDTLPVACPACLRPTTVPWLTVPVPAATVVVGPKGERLLQPKVGHGYAQKEFRATCEGCSLVFGRKQLELRKFANTIGRVKEELEERRKGTGLLP